jgi:hypothetical protein
MLTENEVVMLILGIGVLFLILKNLDHIKKIKSWKILVASYYAMLSGWVFTVVEGFFLGNIFNFAEHTCYMISALLLMIWCFKATQKHKQEEVA